MMPAYGAVRHAGRAAGGGGPYAAADGEEITTLWVGNAAPGTTDAELSDAFAEFGTLLTCFLLPKPSPNGQLAGFVRFETIEEAETALQVVNHGHMEVNGAVLVARMADRNSNPSSFSSSGAPAAQKGKAWSAAAFDQSDGEELATLWVGDVEGGTTDQELYEAFAPYGSLVAAFLIAKPSPNGQLSGFVRYSSGQEAQGALEAVEAGGVYCRSGRLLARWASRNTGRSKTLAADGPGAAPEAGGAAGFEGIVAAEVALLQRENQEWSSRQQQPRQWTQGALRQQHSPATAAASGEEITTLWIGSVAQGTADGELQEALGMFGELQACFLLSKLSPNGHMSGFVRYPTVHEAQTALDHVDAGEVVIRGSPISAKWADRNTNITQQMRAL